MMNEETLKTYCGNCEKETNHSVEYKNHETEPVEILVKNDKDFKTESVWMVGLHIWQISKCNGCEKLTFKHIIRTSREPVSDIVFYFPRNHIRPQPDWYRSLPIKYLELLREIHASINHGAFIVALIGIRTIIDIFAVDKVGDIGSFKQKLKKLLDKGEITKSRATTLEAAIEAGNAAAHRGYKPEKEILFKILDIVDNLLQSEIIDRDSDLIEAKIPKR